VATLLTFRLDHATRERVRARIARDHLTLSAVVTRGLREYVGDGVREKMTGAAEAGSARARELPDHVVAWLRELRASGPSESLSAALADLHARGWPLERLARALGMSKQAVQARIRRATRARATRADAERTVGAAIRAPWSAIAQRRPPEPDGPRPHLTVRIDQALRAAAHRAAASEGRSLSQVVESILHRYLNPDE
jgi:antitoxin component of RelBE/YafQ-DinJ toxin-antitoxin module